MEESDSPSPLSAGQIEIWKKIVDVQQHFNDLELRIRNFALVVTGAFLGLAGYAIKDGGFVDIFGLKVSMAGLVVSLAILPLLAFYFMDRLWYHRLLDGAVLAGIDAESALKRLGYEVDLGSKIKDKSPFSLWISGTKIHSKTKMDIFYLTLIGALLLVAGLVCFGVRPQPMPISAVFPPAAETTKNSTRIAPTSGLTNRPPVYSAGAHTTETPAPKILSK